MSHYQSGGLPQDRKRRAELALLLLALAALLFGWPAARLAHAATPGTVAAWGDNSNGQSTVPAGLSDATAIAAGAYHSLALKSDGTVVGWGFNLDGETAIPVGLSGVTAITAGFYHSLALKNDGTIVGWGYNNDGETTIPAGLSGVTAIAAGNFHNLALKSDGTVVAWGDNSAGQTTIPADLSDVTAIAAGGYHNLALKRDGTLVAWGDNSEGQLNVPAGLSDVTAISAGFYHSLALKRDGTVVAWGWDRFGQNTVPAGLSGVTAIAAGELHNLALKRDGTVVAWAYNNDGQSTVPAGLSGVTTIAAGLSTSLAIYTPPADSTPPTIAFANRTAPNPAGWNNGPVTVQWSCSDTASGVTSASASQTLSTDGANQSATGTCTDNAGNSASDTQTGINIDTRAPTLAPVVGPSPVRVGQSASASPNATDALSGIASQSCGALDTSSAGTRSVSCTATDNAGNSASVSVSYTVLPAVLTTSVLDTFDRANGKVGSNWQGLSGSSFYTIVSNRLDVQLGGPIVWKSAFGASQEAFVTLSTIDTTSPSTGMLLKVQDSGRAEAGAILVVYDAKAKKVRISAIRLGAREWTLYLNQAAAFANGDVLGARAKADGTVEVSQNGTRIASVTLNAADRAFFNSKGGKIGLWALAAPKAFFDDFGGGTVAP